MGVCGQVSKVVEKDEGGFFSGIGVKHSVDEPATVSTKAWRNFLPCDGSCEVAERNKRLAEALEIDTARNGPAIGSSAAGDEAVPIEYPDSMLSFAKANSAFVKALEKDFADFLLDRTRKSTRMLTSAKRIYLAFAQRLASQFYEFDAIIEDPDSKAPGLFLKKKTATKIPGILASEAATQPPKPRVPKPSAPTAGMACNAFHLLGIAWGMDSRSISILLEPLFGTSVGSPVINWQGEDDLLVTVRPLGTSDPAVIETFLKGVKGQVSDKFVGNGWAKEVRLCWVDRNLKVREEEGQKIKDEPSSSQVVQGPGPAVLDTRNQFEVLDSEREEAEKDGALKPKVADSWGDQPADQETVDTWETLAE